MKNPIVYSLEKLPWAVFGTVTWANDFKQSNSDRAAYFRYGDTVNFFGSACSDLGLHQRKLALYWKEEMGSDGNHAHLHFVIGKHELSDDGAKELATTLNRKWTHGMCKVELFDNARRDEGLRYVSKGSEPVNEYVSPALKTLCRALN